MNFLVGSQFVTTQRNFRRKQRLSRKKIKITEEILLEKNVSNNYKTRTADTDVYSRTDTFILKKQESAGEK